MIELEIKTSTAEASAIGVAASAQMLEMARHMSPELFRASLIALIMNVSGNLPDDYWSQMISTLGQPCGEPNCRCHEPAALLLDALKNVRAYHKAAFARHADRHTQTVTE